MTTLEDVGRVVVDIELVRVAGFDISLVVVTVVVDVDSSVEIVLLVTSGVADEEMMPNSSSSNADVTLVPSVVVLLPQLSSAIMKVFKRLCFQALL